MDKLLKIAVTLTAVDKMSRVFRDAVGASETSLKRLAEQRDKAFGTGAGFLGAGAAVGAALMPAVAAFAELEDASSRLKSAMMGPGGVVSEAFPAMDKLANSLGDRLPGTTADFYSMFEVMLNSGVNAKTILEGVGEAASYLAVAIKMPYEEAGKFAAKMKESTGVADKDMLQFMDTIARVKNLGVEAGEMQYAFGRSGGALKLMGLQGLEASKSLSNVYAQLIRAGVSGETVGTGISAIFNSMLDPKKMQAMNAEAAKLGLNLQFFKDGKFMGVENMIAQFDKLRGFNAEQRAGVVNALTGGGQDASMLQTLISNGVEGFNKMNQQMASQATLNQKVGVQLETLSAKWEATTGTIQNAMAAFGGGLADALKPIVDMLGTIAGWLKTVFDNNPALAKFISMFVAASGVFLTAIGIINMVKGAFIALRIVMMANPFILVATLAILAISLIYAHWDKIKAWFTNLWNTVKSIFVAAWTVIKSIFLNYTPHGLIFKNWDKIVAWFTNLWQNVKNIFLNHVTWMLGLGSKFFNAGKNIVTSIWEGIKAMASKPVEAIKDIVGKVREFLPFSPAKVGPLKDIHRIKLIETIADSIKPNSLMQKMQSVAGSLMGFTPRGAGMAMAPAGGGGGVTVNMNINFSGGTSPGAANSFVAELRKHKNEISRIFEEAMAQKQRRAF